MDFLKRYWLQYWKPFCLAISFLMLEAACDIMQPTIMSRIVDVGVAGRDLGVVLQMGAWMLAITALQALVASGRNIISSRVSMRFGRDLRSDLFRKINTFSFDNLDQFETASLVTRLTNDVTQVQNFVHGLMRIFVRAPLLCIGSLVMASLINLRLALVLITIVPAVGVLIYTNMRIGYPLFRKVQKALDGVNGVIREYLAGVRVVKAFNRFRFESVRFARSNEELADVSTSAMRVMAVFSPAITLTVNLGIVAVLWLGGFRVNNGEMRVGQVIAFTNYMTQILFSLMMISFVFTMFVRARASAERIGEVLRQENTMQVKNAPQEEGERRGTVEFQQVSFSYSGASGDPVLRDISFSYTSGETVGIIGSTGAGKTTLVNLVPRFYDVTSGCVKVDGVDVRDINPAVLREKIAVVPQKNVLFTGTIRDNIRWGRETASQEEIEQAAAAAEAHGFISSFADGYDTLLGQGGVNLSGGQKQRISIARALVRKPDILILDDCTSAVDVVTEAKIRRALKNYASGLTCIVIAQRVTSVMGADRIIVLDNGKIEGCGCHEELMESCRVYRDIYLSQIGKEGE